MNWLFNLSLQAFSPESFKERDRTFWTLEISSFLIEFLIYFYWTQSLMKGFFILTTRVSLTSMSLIRLFFKIQYSILFLFFFPISYKTTTFSWLFNKSNIKAKNIKDLLAELKELIICDLLDTPLSAEKVNYLFFKNRSNKEIRELLFKRIEEKITKPDILVNSNLLHNTFLLTSIFKDKMELLSDKERAILACLGFKISVQNLPGFKHVPQAQDFLPKLEALGISWNCFPQLGIFNLDDKSYLNYRYLDIHSNRNRQVINLALYFYDSSSLDAAYHKLYGNKKAMKKEWDLFFSRNPSIVEVISWFNFNILASNWQLNYDEVLKIVIAKKTPKFFYITSTALLNKTQSSPFIKYLKTYYNDARIIKLLIKDGGNSDFNDCFTMGIQYSGVSSLINPPKKPKSFSELHDFFQIYGKYSEESNQKLNQRTIVELHNKQFNNFIIKVPSLRKELLLTGKRLSICVGYTDIYTRRVNQGESFILFLYEQDSPRYCLEICPQTLTAKQAKGNFNHPINPEIKLDFELFLSKFLTKQPPESIFI